MADEKIYLMQPSFTGGEISPEVANRIDLDKYQQALLNAENAYIRPYGAVYKRTGSEYCGQAKKGNVLLMEFQAAATEAYLLEVGEKYIRIWKNGKYTGIELSTPYTWAEVPALRTCQSADIMYIASGTHPVMQLCRYSDTSWRLVEMTIDKPYFDISLCSMIESGTGYKLTPSALSGTIRVTSSGNLFTSDMVGAYIKLSHEMASQTISVTGTQTSGSVLVGSQWKIITHGTWTGTIKIQTQSANGNWKDYRSYTSEDDFNASESGTVDTPTYFRIVSTAGQGEENGTADLTSLPYTHEGYMRITGYTSATVVTGTVIDSFGSTEATDDYALSAWCPRFGYPRTVGFFQDRLIFGGTTAQPYEVWMSRTGDYGNFSVEKVSGTVTDDSAIALAFISRKQAEIQHLCPGADLFVLTDSNEWIVSGGSTVTPTKCTNKAQTFRGSSEVPPLSIGARMIYIQKRSQSVRDFAYTFETDSYDGSDLTLLAKHLFRGKQITDAAYMQDPDSRLYFVRSDGVMLCLAYVQDQKVYAWSHLKTDGQYISVCNIAGATKDEVYVAVKRNNGSVSVTMIERLSDLAETENPMDYVMLDCAVHVKQTTETDSVTVSTFSNKIVTVLADGKHYDSIKMNGNKVTIPAKAKDWIVGLSYTMKIEVPNVEYQDQRGTSQGRTKKLSKVTLRLINSLGGKVGNGVGAYDEIKYDEFSDQETTLYSGDKDVTIPNQSAEKNGRVLIESDAPYPFNLAGIVRGVKSLD